MRIGVLSDTQDFELPGTGVSSPVASKPLLGVDELYLNFLSEIPLKRAGVVVGTPGLPICTRVSKTAPAGQERRSGLSRFSQT